MGRGLLSPEARHNPESIDSQESDAVLSKALAQIYSRFNLGLNVRTFTTDATLDVSDALALCDTSIAGALISLTLSPANSWSSRSVSKTPILIFQHIGGTFPVQINAGSGDTINGNSSITLTQFKKIELFSNGNSQWYTFMSNGVTDTPPLVTIDPAHAKTVLNAADAATIKTQMAFQNSATSLSASIQTAVNYSGSGILTKCLIGEFAALGTAAFNARLQITIDGVVVYNDTAAISRESSMRVVVGNQIVSTNTTPTTLQQMIDSSIGLPFNQSCKIEYLSDGTRTVTVAWHIDKRT